MNFSDWFASVAEKPPFPYQVRLATTPELPLLLNVPTGAGKTAAAVLSWIWRRCKATETIRTKTPRRLVYCLPMRTLVEQTEAAVVQWLENAKLNDEVKVYALMGGSTSARWDAVLEHNSIIIGTQDQLLSRALNRGYGMSRYRWPIHFALLNNDCLWVMDETQLMGAGLTTTAQLQHFRESFQTYGPAQSLWMSATLDETALHTVDYHPDFNQIESLNLQDRACKILQKRMDAKKQLVKAKTVFAGKEDEYALALAKEVAEAHTPGTLTIVIVNRVSRSQAVYAALEKYTNERFVGKDSAPQSNKMATERLLIHSRFRTEERKKLNQRLRSGNLSGILVATQAIEAGVDISAKCLFAEVAPWSSLVQRFGRCNRYGEDSEATVFWIDMDLTKKETAIPYESDPLQASGNLLKDLSDVGPESLSQIKVPPQEIEGLILRKTDLIQLFDTAADLAGHDIDVSPFIRDAKNNDVAIAWREWSDERTRDEQGNLQPNELCRVSLGQAKDYLKKHTPLVWDGWLGQWTQAKEIYAGMSLLLPCSAGGYSEELGFTGKSDRQPVKPAFDKGKNSQGDRDDADFLSYNFSEYVTLKSHSEDVAKAARDFCENLGFDLPIELIERAARWHDLGKAHEVFQEMLTRDNPDKQNGGPWAKSDRKANVQADRRGFRHELVSALVALGQGEDFLLTYLVAAHHGKVRMTIQPLPDEKAPTGVKLFARGVWEGDRLPIVDLGDGLTIPAQTLCLDWMTLGDNQRGESYAAQAIALLEKYGPFRLAFLETIVRLADWQASVKEKADILETSDA